MIEIDDIGGVSEAFERAARQFGDSAFLRAPEGIDWTYDAARKRVTSLAAGYAAAGLTAGSRVALVLDAHLDVYLHLLALNKLGVSAVPLHTGGSDGDLRYMIDHSDSRLLVTRPEYRARIEPIALEAGACPVYVEDDLLAASAAPVGDERFGPEVEAAMLYTSGTTGKPKGCRLSNAYFLKLGRWYNEMGGLCPLERSDRLLTPLPPNHMNALCTSFMGMLLCGGCVIQLDRFHPRTWWQTVRDERATIIHYLGVMPAMLLTLPPGEGGDRDHTVRFGFGAGCDPRHQEVFEQRFGFPLVEGWAMTESGAGGLTVANKEPRHVGERCIGRPIAGMEFRLVDEQDRDVEAGADGELLVRSKGAQPRAGFFSGYHKDEAATEEGWRGGWWHTGDVVREGPDGSLFFVDRRKNVIRRSGENIAAVEVEATLLQCPQVSNCAVAAVPDEIRGDEVFAFVVPRECDSAERATAAQIFDFCHAGLAYFKTPGYIAFVDELPLTASQKVNRGEVKKRARQQLGQDGCFDLRDRKKRRLG